MRSLKELAKLAVLKLGLGDEECIPVTVREELRCMEEAIRADMTGWGYHKYSRGEMSLEFDISWSRGCWSFLLRRGTENGWTEMSAEITAKSQSILQPEWADLFGFDYMRARLHGLRFTDFKLDMEERRVTFAGYYGSPQDDVPLNQFSTELWFTCSSHYVKIKTGVGSWCLLRLGDRKALQHSTPTSIRQKHKLWPECQVNLTHYVRSDIFLPIVISVRAQAVDL